MKSSPVHVGGPSPRPTTRGAPPVEEITVFIPVTCPRCGLAGLMESPVIVVRTALTLWNNMRLYAECHSVAWNASRTELNHIRDYLSGNTLAGGEGSL